MITKYLGGVWIRFYFPLCLTVISVALLLLSFQAQIKKQESEITIARLDRLAYCLSEIQHSLSKGTSEEVLMQQKHGRWVMEEVIAHLHNTQSVPSVYEDWKRKLSEPLTAKPTSRDFSRGFQRELHQGIYLNEEMLAYFASEAGKEDKFMKWCFGFALLAFAASVFQLFSFFTHQYYRALKKLKKDTADLLSQSSATLVPEQYHFLLKPLAFNISHFHGQVNELREVSDQIGAGNFQQDIAYLKSFGAFGDTLFNMREKIKVNQEEENRRRWSSQSLEHFAKVLREYNEQPEELYKRVISELVSFVGANQAGLFLVEGEEQSLALKAAYAWGRQKYHKKRCLPGEGLVGQAVLDAETIYINDVPDDYINITSGLGKANPSCILLVPLIYNDRILGVIELASLQEMEKHQIVLVEKLAESLASTLSGILSTHHTRKLLEESQRITQELQRKEEELRNNSEELEMAKENLSTKLEEATKEMELRIREIEGERKKNIAILEGCVDGVITFNQEGEIEFFNQAAEEIWNVQRSLMVGRSIKEIIPIEFIKEGGRVKAFHVWEGQMKPIDIRTELVIKDYFGEEMTVLLTLSDACEGDAANFALFIQRISVELF